MRKTMITLALSGALLVTVSAGAYAYAGPDDSPGAGGQTCMHLGPSDSRPDRGRQAGPGDGLRGMGPSEGLRSMERSGAPGAGPMMTRERQRLQDPAQISSLNASDLGSALYMLEEEKMARDLYTLFSDTYPNETIFARIASSEQQHMDMMLNAVSSQYDFTELNPGVFKDENLQATYDKLSAQGLQSLQGALDAGVSVEKDDIAVLKEAIGSVDSPELKTVYSHLLDSSTRHLAAFERQL